MSQPQETLSALACHVCKRRKSKWVLPSCSTCLKSSQTCVYPTSSQKPGPKAGNPRHISKRRRLDNNDDGLSDDDSQSSHYLVPESPARSSQTWNNGSVSKKPPGFGLQSPAATNSTLVVPEDEDGSPEESILAQVIHPSHEPVSEIDNAAEDYIEEEVDIAARTELIFKACTFFKISFETYQHLLSSYFDNMTAFNLFHRPTFDLKLQKLETDSQVHALLSAMFSFSARFEDRGRKDPHVQIPSPGYFHDLASRQINECLDECSDQAPPLCILQALVLVTFQELVRGVRGRAWRRLGTCVRIAYELELHLEDSRDSWNGCYAAGVLPIRQLIEKEERRRVWWTIWEFDVFASTIRRLPLAIDWSSNFAWLPIDDELWYTHNFQTGCVLSCFLSNDPASRWQALERCGNQGSKAWFIAINATMRDCQQLSRSTASTNGQGKSARPSSSVARIERGRILSAALRDLPTALPTSLRYQGEFLSFRKTERSDSYSLPYYKDSSRYSIHLMTQLTTFMLYHKEFLGTVGQSAISPLAQGQRFPITNYEAWDKYLSSIDNVVALVRNSTENHARSVNPFLANIIWIAAAAQITCRIFGPANINHQVAMTNFELLRGNFNRHVEFWGVSEILKEKLEGLEARLGILGAVGLRAGNTSRRLPESDTHREDNRNSMGVESWTAELGNEPGRERGIGQPMESSLVGRTADFGFLGGQGDTFDFLGLDQFLNYYSHS